MRGLKPLHFGISTNNMEESIEWYRKNLDFEVFQDDYVPPLKARLVFMRNDYIQVEIFQHDEWKPIPQERLHPDTDIQTLGMKHMAFETEDMESLKEKFRNNDVVFVHEDCMKGNQVLYVRDNAGVLLEFIQYT